MRAKKSNNFFLTTVVWKEDKQFVSHCPELGVASVGKSPDEATVNLKEAVELYIKNAVELGLMPDLLPALKVARKYTTSFTVASP